MRCRARWPRRWRPCATSRATSSCARGCSGSPTTRRSRGCASAATWWTWMRSGSLGTDSLAQTLEDRERLALLCADLGDLPERQRMALVLRELSGLSHEEIAGVLDSSARAVKQTIFEARAGLQECEEGRTMLCADVQRALSDGDGRVLRGRRMRAHVRSCRACRTVQDRARPASGRPRRAGAGASGHGRGRAARPSAPWCQGGPGVECERGHGRRCRRRLGGDRRHQGRDRRGRDGDHCGHRHRRAQRRDGARSRPTAGSDRACRLRAPARPPRRRRRTRRRPAARPASAPGGGHRRSPAAADRHVSAPSRERSGQVAARGRRAAPRSVRAPGARRSRRPSGTRPRQLAVAPGPSRRRPVPPGRRPAGRRQPSPRPTPVHPEHPRDPRHVGRARRARRRSGSRTARGQPRRPPTRARRTPRNSP